MGASITGPSDHIYFYFYFYFYFFRWVVGFEVLQRDLMILSHDVQHLTNINSHFENALELKGFHSYIIHTFPMKIDLPRSLLSRRASVDSLMEQIDKALYALCVERAN